jgi:NTP pyrophosphatase (non-canonical NTP hydrolase)
MDRFKKFQIPIPKDISKLKPQLTKLSKLHNKISEITESIPQKEKDICDKIKELTEDGEEGVDWDEYELGKIEQPKTEVKPAEAKVAEVKEPAKELVEGEEIAFKTSRGSRVTGEKVEVPGYEDMDLVLVKDGFENRIYELSSGLEIGGTQEAFSKEAAIESLRKQLAERKITSEKIHNVIFKGEKVKQINPSKKFESYAESRTAREKSDYESLPLKFTPKEIAELQVEIAANNQDKMEAEFGDVLFSMINYARFLNINPEDALERTNKKFINRFKYLESKAIELGKSLSDMSLAEMDVFWEEAKKG